MELHEAVSCVREVLRAAGVVPSEEVWNALEQLDAQGDLPDPLKEARTAFAAAGQVCTFFRLSPESHEDDLLSLVVGEVETGLWLHDGCATSRLLGKREDLLKPYGVHLPPVLLSEASVKLEAERLLEHLRTVARINEDLRRREKPAT